MSTSGRVKLNVSVWILVTFLLVGMVFGSIPVRSHDNGDGVSNAGARVIIMMAFNAADGTAFCAADDTPYGNCTLYELPAEVPFDSGNTPEDYGGWVSNPVNGIFYFDRQPKFDLERLRSIQQRYDRP